MKIQRGWPFVRSFSPKFMAESCRRVSVNAIRATFHVRATSFLIESHARNFRTRRKIMRSKGHGPNGFAGSRDRGARLLRAMAMSRYSGLIVRPDDVTPLSTLNDRNKEEKTNCREDKRSIVAAKGTHRCASRQIRSRFVDVACAHAPL